MLLDTQGLARVTTTLCGARTTRSPHLLSKRCRHQRRVRSADWQRSSPHQCRTPVTRCPWPTIPLTSRRCCIALSTDREQVSHASCARAGRSRQCPSKWAGPDAPKRAG